jgi:hypothetical protein
VSRGGTDIVGAEPTTPRRGLPSCACLVKKTKSSRATSRFFAKSWRRWLSRLPAAPKATRGQGVDAGSVALVAHVASYPGITTILAHHAALAPALAAALRRGRDRPVATFEPSPVTAGRAFADEPLPCCVVDSPSCARTGGRAVVLLLADSVVAGAPDLRFADSPRRGRRVAHGPSTPGLRRRPHFHSCPPSALFNRRVCEEHALLLVVRA